MSHFAKTFFTDIDKFYNAETKELSEYFYKKLPTVSAERRARVERALISFAWCVLWGQSRQGPGDEMTLC